MSYHWVCFLEYCKARLSQNLDIGERKVKVKVLVAQLCLTLCDLMDYSPPGSSVQRIFQAGILERVAVPFSRGLPDPGIEPTSPALASRFLGALPSALGFLVHAL